MNAALTMLIYKPLVNALRRAGLLENSRGGGAGTRNLSIILVSLLVVATCVLCVLVLRGRHLKKAKRPGSGVLPGRFFYVSALTMP